MVCGDDEMKIRERIRNGVNRMAESTGIFKKDVFELEGVPAFREYYQLFVFIWQAIYKGYYEAWHDVDVKTINTPKGKKRRMATMNAGKMGCSQMARYAWNEQCQITASMTGNDTEEDLLNDFLQETLKNNGFWKAFGDILEKSFALGGCALREWVEVPKDINGNDIGEGKVKIGYTMASQFVPTAWDNNKVNAGIFISREARDGFYYTVVEWHRLDGTTYRVTNDLYRMPIKEATEPQNILGWWYPLNMIYPLLSPDTTIENVQEAFFQYIKPFGANYADDNSPLGMSIFSPALDTLHTIDIIFDSFQREFVLGKKRIIAPARAMKAVAINGALPQKYFDADDEVYEALATDSAEDLKITDNSVSLRVADHVAAINAQLAILCAQIGFDPGTLTFDAVKGLKTATEVISENSKTYGTVKSHENIIKDNLEDMVHAIFDLAVRYKLTYKGKMVESLIANGYSVAIKFDDSIIQDKAAEINQGLAQIGAGVLSRKKFMMDTLKYTEEEADAELKQIAEEKRINAVEVTRLFGNME